jgi:hypothetical protein
MQPSSFPRKWIALGLASLVVVGLISWRLAGYLRTPPVRGDKTENVASDGLAAFRERGREAGLDFHMTFLNAEQGKTFKINLYDHGCGVTIADFDGDGLDDVYFCNQLGSNGLYRNRGNGSFENVTDAAGVGLADRVCVGAVFADYDNDGHPDLFVTSTRGGNVLFHNNGDGTFTDVTQKAGVAHVGHSQTASFFDFDNDGYLDLFVTNTAQWTTNTYDSSAHYYPGLTTFLQTASSPLEANILYHNEGNGTFTDATARAGLKGKGWGGDVAVFDFNEDGWLDLLVTNMFGASQLYRNNGGKTFTDVTRDILGRTSFGAIGSKVFDFNNDGRLDLLIVDMHSDMWLNYPMSPRTTKRFRFDKKYDRVTGPMYKLDPSSEEIEKFFAKQFQLEKDATVFGNTLFQKMPSGRFAEVSDKAKLETWWPWGVATGDFDNDGYEDVFLPSGMGHPWEYWPNALMMNNGDGTFADRADSLGIEPPPEGCYLPEKIADKRAARSSRCAAVADFDGDGRLDLVVNNFNDRAFYFRNHFPKKNWIAFRLTGTKSNRDAVGAVVTIYLGQRQMVRQVQAAGGYLSQSSNTVHFGLGKHDEIDGVEIRWPSGAKKTIDRPAINQLHRITEGK